MKARSSVGRAFFKTRTFGEFSPLEDSIFLVKVIGRGKVHPEIRNLFVFKSVINHPYGWHSIHLHYYS